MAQTPVIVKTKSDKKLWKKAEDQQPSSDAVKDEKAATMRTFLKLQQEEGKPEESGKSVTEAFTLRQILCHATIAEFLAQAETIITAEEPAPAPVKRAAPVPSTKVLDENSQEAKDFVNYTNMLADVEGQLKHAIGIMNSYSSSFQKELTRMLKLFDAKKTKLTMGDVRAMAMLVDAVQKVMRAVDSVADRFEFLNDGVRKLSETTKPSQSMDVTDPNKQKKLGLAPLKDIDNDLKQGEMKTKFKDFFKEMKNKFGSKPQAASVMLAHVLITTAKTLSE